MTLGERCEEIIRLIDDAVGPIAEVAASRRHATVPPTAPRRTEQRTRRTSGRER